MEPPTRTFAALEVPDETKERIGRFIEEIRPRPGAFDLKWVSSRILHVTVRFFGDLDRKQLGKARGAIRTLDHAWDPPRLEIGPVGAFPNARRPQVIWLGIEDPDGGLRDLAASVDSAIRVAGFGPADKPFVGHLTLARLRRGMRVTELSELVGGLTPPGGALTISSITLFKSDLRPGGPVYTPLECARPRKDPAEPDPQGT